MGRFLDSITTCHQKFGIFKLPVALFIVLVVDEIRVIEGRKLFRRNVRPVVSLTANATQCLSLT